MLAAVPWAAWASLAAGCWVTLLRPEPAWLVRHRLGGPCGTIRWPLLVVALAVAPVLPVALRLVEGVAALIVVATGAAVAAFSVSQVRRSHRRTQARRCHREVAEIVDVLAAELRAGVLPHQGLATVAADLDLVVPAARAAAAGGDVPEVLRSVARAPGCAGLAAVAAAWQVSEECGAPLSAVLDRVARAQRFETELSDEVSASLEPARATGRLLAVLPVFGLLLGAGLGSDPVRVVTTTLPGALCLAAGALLACLGVRWIDATADRAEAS
ncbi:MAG: type II secretion system protein [Aeromicrobium sp.]|uniref:type II secretion system F family protein n=1 Tax=Aeromicrobium sp. TaxID=1871063 RepID=UPI0039E55ABC